MAESKNFIEQIIDEELKEGGRVYGKKIHTILYSCGSLV